MLSRHFGRAFDCETIKSGNDAIKNELETFIHAGVSLQLREPNESVDQNSHDLLPYIQIHDLDQTSESIVREIAPLIQKMAFDLLCELKRR